MVVCVLCLCFAGGCVIKPVNLSTLCLVYMFRCTKVFALCVCVCV